MPTDTPKNPLHEAIKAMGRIKKRADAQEKRLNTQERAIRLLAERSSHYFARIEALETAFEKACSDENGGPFKEMYDTLKSLREGREQEESEALDVDENENENENEEMEYDDESEASDAGNAYEDEEDDSRAAALPG